MEEEAPKPEDVSGYLSEDEQGAVTVDDQPQAGSSKLEKLNRIVEGPMQYIKNMIPFVAKEEEADGPDPKVELMGDKLRKKRNRTKRRSNPSYKRSLSEHDLRKIDIKYSGSDRSIVRYIGSNMPINPQNRQYFELFDTSSNAFMSRAQSFFSNNMDQMRQHVDQVKYRVVPSLADLGQLVWEDFKFAEDSDEDEMEVGEGGEEEEELEADLAPEEQGITFVVEAPSEETPFVDVPSSSAEPVAAPPECSSAPAKKEDAQKITDLQDELAKLRAQIAMIVAAQNAPAVAAAAPPSQTPIAVVPPTFMPPPPPPPPPPPTFSTPKVPSFSVKKKIEKDIGEETVPQKSGMEDVLKGIANVRLKSTDIEKSPGGTPMRKNKSTEDPTNPSDIIAKALREKFQNTNMNYNSPERVDSPESGFSPSPIKKTNSFGRIQPTATRPTPKPRPRPRPRVQKKTEGECEDVTERINF